MIHPTRFAKPLQTLRTLHSFRALSRTTAVTLLLFIVGTLTGCSDGDNDRITSIVSGEFLALTYNVAGLPQGLSGSNPEANTPLISPLLNNYDLVLVQEDWQTPEPNPLAPLRLYHEVLAAQAEHPFQSDPAPLPLGEDPRRPGALVSDGLNRFSQFPFGVLLRQAWEGCDNNSGDCLAFKGFSVARTELSPGVCVDVYNVHGEAGNNAGDRELKTANTRDLVDFINMFSVGRSIIVGGDFNLRLRRAPDAENLNFLTSETGITNACAALGNVDEEAIDKFFFRSNGAVTLTPVSCQFETNVFVTDDNQPLSDHDALAVGFTWTGTPVPDIDCL